MSGYALYQRHIKAMHESALLEEQRQRQEQLDMEYRSSVSPCGTSKSPNVEWEGRCFYICHGGNSVLNVTRSPLCLVWEGKLNVLLINSCFLKEFDWRNQFIITDPATVTGLGNYFVTSLNKAKLAPLGWDQNLVFRNSWTDDCLYSREACSVGAPVLHCNCYL